MRVKILALFLIGVVALNLTLFILQITSSLVFWAILGVIAFVAYKALPYLKNKEEKEK
jgi:hypothetical protein